jgi:hypothetical protein
MAEKMREVSGVSYKITNPIHEDSCSNRCPKAPSTYTISLDVSVSAYEFMENTAFWYGSPWFLQEKDRPRARGLEKIPLAQEKQTTYSGLTDDVRAGNQQGWGRPVTPPYFISLEPHSNPARQLHSPHPIKKKNHSFEKHPAVVLAARVWGSDCKAFWPFYHSAVKETFGTLLSKLGCTGLISAWSLLLVFCLCQFWFWFGLVFCSAGHWTLGFTGKQMLYSTQLLESHIKNQNPRAKLYLF